MIDVLGNKNEKPCQFYLLVSNYKKNGSLLDFIMKSLKKDRPISILVKLYLCKCLYIACKNLWKKDGICHNDLKPDNILFNDDLTLMLCDFGHSSGFTELLDDNFGTVNYRAPEINERTEKFYAPDAEIFSFASVIFVIFFGRYPFDEMAWS